MAISRACLLVTVALFMSLASYGTASAQDSQAIAAVRAADVALSKLWCVDKNLDAFVSVWEPTGSVMTANAPVATGTAAVRALFAPFVGLLGFHCGWDPVQIEVARSGELAHSRGTYRTSYTDAQGRAVEDRGSYLTVWRKDGKGKWRVVFDTFASELPASRN